MHVSCVSVCEYCILYFHYVGFIELLYTYLIKVIYGCLDLNIIMSHWFGSLFDVQSEAMDVDVVQ